MARGYSASRSKSGRPPLRLKRERSLSMQVLKETTDARRAAVAAANEEKPPAAPLKSLKITRSKRLPSASATTRGLSHTARAPSAQKSADGGSARPTSAGATGGRSRSMSSLRTRVEDLEDELQSELEASEDEHETVAKPDVMTKYKAIGRAVDEVLDELAAACVPGVNTKALCDQGDLSISAHLKRLFTKARHEDGTRLARGVAYPTNVSVNEVLCNHAPYREEEGVCLHGNDVVKLHLGCHLDGYPVSAARTIVVPASATSGASAAAPRRAVLNHSASNAIEAARVALTGMIHLLRPGTLNADITDFIARVGNGFEVQAVEGVLSNRVKRWVADGIDCIIARRINTEDPHQDVADCAVGEQQVWTLDVAFTNHDTYRITPTEEAATIFRRTPVQFTEDARVSKANETLTEITNNYFCFPFHFKSLENPLRAKLALGVLQRAGVVDRLPVLRSKGTRHITSRFSATVAVTAKRITVLCGAPPAQPLTLPDELQPPSPPEDVAEVLARPLEFATAAALKRRASEQPQHKRARTENEEEA